MGLFKRGVAVTALVLAAGVVAAAKSTTQGAVAVKSAPAHAVPRPRPRLVDLGAGKCIPCKAMAPILEELKAEYAGRLDVEFIDVWKDPAAGERFGINMIPTQIFFADDGRELARHEGFMGKEEILARWKALGVKL